MTNHSFPFEIHALAVEGLSVLVRANNAITADSVTLYPGGSIEIDESRYELSKDIHGNSWMDLTTEQQVEKWGRARFGLGEPPAHVLAIAKAARDSRLRAERDNLLRTNPHLAKSTAASARLDVLNAALRD